jgi:hypothetical protein
LTHSLDLGHVWGPFSCPQYRRRRHVGGYPGTNAALRCRAPTGAPSPSYIASHGVTPCEGGGDVVEPASGSSHIGTCYEFVSIYVLCGWHQPLALWPIEPTIFAPESNPWTAVGKDRRRAAILAAAPSPPLELQRRSQSMPCMKHLIEAERESSVPSSKPRKTSDG